MEATDPPAISQESVLMASGKLPDGVRDTVKGYDFNMGANLDSLLKAYSTTGFQATLLAAAIEEINRMLDHKLSVSEQNDASIENAVNPNPYGRPRTNCTIFLAFTSNMISCGVRETIRYLVEHNMVDVLVTTGGAIEEDLMKCMAPFYVGDFHKWKGQELRRNGINRIGNILVPNDGYCEFEKWVLPIFDQMLLEQRDLGTNWTPSKLTNRLGREINNSDSVLYWCHKNGIPVFCPAITDGACGDALYFHSYKNPGLTLDLIEDIRLMNSQAVYAKASGMIILGGGVVKHHTCNANLMRNGADYSVFINTGQEFDGSDSGARPDEAISWGKIKMQASPVKLSADASLVFPLIASQTFVKRVSSFDGNCKQNQSCSNCSK